MTSSNSSNNKNDGNQSPHGAVLSTESPSPSASSSSSAAAAPRAKISVQDVVGVAESPAETAMLESIEESRKESGASSDDDPASAWSGFPSVRFDPSTMNQNKTDDDNDDDNNNDKEQQNLVDDAPSVPRSGSSRQRLMRETSRSSSSRRRLTHQESTRPLLQQAHHRRGKSVEATLNGLAAALSAMEMDDEDRRRTERQESEDSLATSETEPLSSAADFARQGLRLHNQQTTAAGNRWTRLRENLGAARDSASSSAESTLDESSQTAAPKHDNSGGRPDAGMDTSPTGALNDLKGGDIESQQQKSQASSSSEARKKKTKKHKKKKKHIGGKLSAGGNDLSWGCLNNFFRPRRKQLMSYIKTLVLFILCPLVGVAAILFYLVENPPTGETNENSDTVTNDTQASISWILLFCARQVITFSLSLAMQAFLVDFLALNTRFLLRLVGPVVSLVIVQSRGWPMIFFWWGITNFCMLFGNWTFAHHWGYATEIGLFNERNPSGNIASNSWYRSALLCMISVSVVVAIKRFLIGLYFGRKTYAHYGKPLAKVMNKMLMISRVATLAKEIEQAAEDNDTAFVNSFRWESKREMLETEDAVEDDASFSRSTVAANTRESSKLIDTYNRDPLTGSLRFSEKIKMMELLDRWEEPERSDRHKNEHASISAVLNFRKALTFIKKDYPFSKAFGPADSREECISSCQEVFARLMKRTPNATLLPFETIAILAMDEEGTLDEHLTKSFVKLFRPDRQGDLTLLDFVRSVDKVYKEFRLLDATIDNSSQIDRAFERIFNVLFYVVVACVTLSQLGFDPLALFLSLSSVILGFAFMIGSASSKYFEGVLFILGRRPYGIGDLIAVGNPESNGHIDGALPWLVENVTLFETEVTHLPTMERASLSNGALASSRIINWHRSPTARFHIFLNFPVDTTFDKLLLFKKAVEEYLKARPREWLALNGFRANRIFADKGYMEHLVIVQHREAWAQVGQVLDSKANITTFCLDVAKQLNIHYKAPPLPVDLVYRQAPDDSAGRDGAAAKEDMNHDALEEGFRSSAMYKHNIFC